MSAATQDKAPIDDVVSVIAASVLGKAPETLSALVEHNEIVWHNSLVSPSVLEAIRLRNARTVNCVVCKSIRYDVARADGFEESKADMVTGAYRDSALTPREKTAIALADCYLGFPVGVSAEVAKEVAGHFSMDEVLSMLVAVVSFNFTSKTAVSHGGMPEEDLPVTEMRV